MSLQCAPVSSNAGAEEVAHARGSRAGMQGLTPRQRYARELERPGFVADPAQERALPHLERLYHELVRADRSRKAPWWRRLHRGRPEPVKGLYLWGGVGRGKTLLVDLFYECLPLAAKRRTHFHRFMGAVHAERKALGHVRDPLALVAERWASARVLCLDELHVGDITDAMLLGNLLAALLERGVTLVATSNEAPGRLYWGGLQRERFLPAIALIERHTEVVRLDGTVDHRLRALERAEIYHCPLDAGAETSLARSFAALAPEPGEQALVLEIDGRPIRTVRCADGVVWFEFEELCGGPRSARDYIEIARCFQTVLLGGVPVLGEFDADRARRFVHLVDELYDRNVKLVVSAAAPPHALYRGGPLAAAFARTASRLVEMQTREYLARPHRSN